MKQKCTLENRNGKLSALNPSFQTRASSQKYLWSADMNAMNTKGTLYISIFIPSCGICFPPFNFKLFSINIRRISSCFLYILHPHPSSTHFYSIQHSLRNCPILWLTIKQMERCHMDHFQLCPKCLTTWEVYLFLARTPPSTADGCNAVYSIIPSGFFF